MLLGTVQAVSFSADPAHGRFPPPWSVEEQPACFVVRDHNGQREGRIMLETPIIVVLVLLAIVAVLWWVYS
jgi:hypothetical protein